MPDSKNTAPIAMPNISEQLAKEIGTEAYIFGYPLVLMDITRQVMTNVPNVGQVTAPINQLGNIRQFPDDTMTSVVSPNADTLYSFAFFDLTNEPLVLSVPEMRNRYYLMQMLDAWTNVFACPGTRTTGSGRGNFVIVGPQWKGTLPPELQKIQAPTNLVWMIGRTQTNGAEDYAAVHAIQDQYKLVPLSSYGKTYKPPTNNSVDSSVDMATPPVEQIGDMDAKEFFSRLNQLMAGNPPAVEDAGTMKRFAAIGIAPGKPFDIESLGLPIAKALEDSVDAGQIKIMATAKKPHGTNMNGWEFMKDVGNYGTNYIWRAIVAFVGLGANLPEDAIYPRAMHDAQGAPLNGSNEYKITFPKGQLPPVGAFWSVTLYNSKQFFAKNPLHRYAIGDRDKLKFNEDGSLTLYIQNGPPGAEKESNWLPAPKENFSLFMRLYWPKKEILEGAWKPPQIERVAETSTKAA
jgi:hypothetical protein